MSPEPARAHIDLQPRLVEQGEVAELSIELPSLRPGAAPTRLEVDGPGVEVESSRSAGVAGEESRWTVRLRIDSSPGPLALVLRALYADGQSVEVEDSVTVVPAIEDGSPRWWIVLAAVLAALALAAAVLGARRRKAW